LTYRERSPTGNCNGKSKLASIIAAKIHHPHAHVTNVHAPAAICKFPDNFTFPLFACQYEPARQENATVRVRKIKKKAMLVRREQMR